MVIKHAHTAESDEVIASSYWNDNHTGTLDHTTDLTNVGTKTHAQIDSHISNNSNPHGNTLTQANLVVNAATGNTLIVDTDTLVANATNNRVGIGTTSPEGKLHVKGGPIAIHRGSSDDFISSDVMSEPCIWSTGNLGGSYPFSDTDLGHLVIQPRVSKPMDIIFITGDGASVSDIRMVIKGDGKVGIGTTSPTGKLDINSDLLRLRTAKTPASAGAAGNAGDICWDANYIYVCVATNTWKRVAIASW